jgi:hypothetical protein
MSPTRDFYRLITAIEDLAEATYEANRLRAKEHREVVALLDARTVKEKEPDGHDVKVSLRSSTLIKFLPWIIAALSGGAEALHRLSGG